MKYSKKNEIDDGMRLIKEFYKTTQFVNHQIDTYNYFITKGMQSIVKREPELRILNDEVDSSGKQLCTTPTMILKFGHVYVDKPKFIHPNRTILPLFPNEARQKNISYEGTIYASLKVINTDTNQSTIHNQVPIGKIPVMLRSNVCNLTENNRIQNKECSNDYGGYFIIKGKERVLIGQLRRAYNKVYVEYNAEDKFKYLAEIRSTNVQGNSILIQLKINTLTHEFFFSLPYIKFLLPAGLVFKALGVSEADMIKYCGVKSNLQIKSILIKQYNVKLTQKDAILSIANELDDDTKDFEYIQTILNKELFYHLGDLTTEKSAIHLGYMMKKLSAVVYYKKTIDDKDSLANKRLDSTSSLICFLFQGLFKQFVKTISNQLKTKKNPDPISVIKSINIITQGLNISFMTGNWNTQKSSTFTRVGVSQVLSMQNYGAKISHLRRIMLPIGKKGKNPHARQLHSSHFSFICPYETPEGDTVGIVSNLALSTQISVEIPKKDVERILERIKIFRKDVDGKILLMINGNIIGSCDDGYVFYSKFNEFRNSDLIDSSVSIVWIKDEQEIHIQTDEGRLLRPLFVIGEKNKICYKEQDLRSQAEGLPQFSWKEHVQNNNIVFREVWELEQSVVAMTEEDLKKNKCDYLEICPAATMMGVMASVIPLSNHSQSPRNAYQASMGKQAIGLPSEAFQYRYDTTLHVLDSPQQPLTKNEMVNMLHFNEMPHGANPIVAIMTYTGFNQEDSVILNKSAIDRGLFTSTTYKTIMEEEKKRGNSDFECICLPKYQYRNRNYDYSLLDDKGLICKKNIYLKKGVVIIGKTSNKVKKGDKNKDIQTSDVSVTIKHGDEGYLDSVLDTMTNEGIRVIKIRIRIPRIPEIGDKFASSTAQKGTCGMIYRQEDMPFDKNGITPDLIINPHAIPSRMTINMLIEMCFNLIGCKLGIEMDATPFKHDNIEKELSDWAEKTNLGSYSSTMFSGLTGDRFPEKIFMAPCFYQRLKHMVIDKIHARVAGPLDTLTHQPVAGRSRDGGLRFGEMEKDCMLSHGSTRILKECLFDKSDKYTIPICMDCGNVPNKRIYCNNCEDNNIEIKNMPYATKLLYQELMGMGLKLKIQ
jgi:DNA-directed RNA polymerase beta subunit